MVDGSIALNLSLTNLAYILKFQGMGIFYLFGKGIPKENIRIGPSTIITLDMEEGDPNPTAGFANPGAPIDQHLKSMEQHLAFLLSTNGLEVSTIQGEISLAQLNHLPSHLRLLPRIDHPAPSPG